MSEPYGNIKKYTGEVEGKLLTWLEKNDYDASELLTNGVELFVKDNGEFVHVNLEAVVA
jgi:hypothetical protein